MREINDKQPEHTSLSIFENDNYSLRYSGPDPDKVERVVVSFPDLIHPTGFSGPGWGEDFFRRREQPVISVLFKNANWYQSDGFFDAMKAAKDFLGSTVKISAYGTSMGGYGAILAGKALKADYVLALCPQYTIQQDIAPFERRYRNQALEIGTFLYDIDAEIDDKINYVVIYDPTHNIDRRHEALFKRPRKWARVPLPGSSHGVLPNILEMASKETLMKLILNQISPRLFRQEIRNGRLKSPRYIRRMGNLTLKKHHHFTRMFIDIARKSSYIRLVEKWEGALNEHQEQRPEIILHPGLPKTGTSAIQLYFKSTARKYARRGAIYPLEGVDPRVFSHSWLSKGLRDGDLTALKHHLKHTPPATKKLILSDESLYAEVPLMAPETRIELKALLAPYSVRIVFCKRPLAAWKKSFYLQALKNRRAATKQGANRLWGTGLSYRRFFEDDFARKLTDINARMADIADLFGADSLEIVQMKPGGNIVPNFCQAAGLAYHQETSSRFVNISMGDVDGEIQRQANNLTANHAGFIKRILGMNVDFDARKLRPNLLINLAKMGADLPWQDFSFKTNAPLKYTKSEFAARIAEIKKLAREIIQAADAL